MRKSYADTRHGQIHYVEAGKGDPVLLLHQTPRSWDEYREVLPLLAKNWRVIAPDTLGFGSSDVPKQRWTIELFADGVTDLIDALELDRVSLVGHHTGGVIALEVAARWPERVDALVLSGTPYVDADRRRRVAAMPGIDDVPISDDGSHYQVLWNRRRGFYPVDRPDLLRRFMLDAMKLGDRIEEGHLAVNAYRMEARIDKVRSRTLVICGEDDNYSLPDVPKHLSAIPDARQTILSGCGVHSVDQEPAAFTAAVAAFLAGR